MTGLCSGFQNKFKKIVLEAKIHNASFIDVCLLAELLNSSENVLDSQMKMILYIKSVSSNTRF